MENNSLKEGKGNSSQKSFIEKFTDSLTLKVFIIFFLMLILLIPLGLIGDLISERNNRESNVSTEIARKWGLDQVITSPIIVVPYDVALETIESSNEGKSNKVVRTVEEQYAFLMADHTKIQADVEPTELKRGIYKTVVYNSKINLKGNFKSFELDKLKAPVSDLRWKDAKIIFGIQDLKGISSNPQFKWDGKEFEMGRYEQEVGLFDQNLTVELPLEGNESLNRDFEISLDLKGSKSLNFLPLAKQTTIIASGKWSAPSFNGNFLPDQREVDKTFKASWNIPDFTRRQPQQWTGDPTMIYNFSGINLASQTDGNNVYTENFRMNESVAPVVSNSHLTANDYDMIQINFLPQVDSYQKSTRVTKYGALVIALTFISLVFIEIIKKQRVHLIQYVLIGLAMVLFYALLLAISEHVGFNFAYLIASGATVMLISIFIKAITHDMKSALNFAAILTLFYVFIFVLLQLRDYSLIVGTIGLFFILAVLMRFSTRIKWDQSENNEKAK